MNELNRPLRPFQHAQKKQHRLQRTGVAVKNSIVRHKLWSAAIFLVLIGVIIGSILLLNKPKQSQAQLSNPAVAAYQKNLPDLKKAVQDNPDDTGARKGYGVALYATGDLDGAKVQYEKAVDINDKDALAYNYLGNTYRDLENIEKAVDAYQKALSIDPKMANTYTNLANIQLYSQNKPQEAIATYKRALNELPDNQEIRLLLGIAYERTNDTVNAKKTYQAILAKNSDNIAAQSNLDRLNKQ